MLVPRFGESEKVRVKIKALYSGLLAVIFLFPSVLSYYIGFYWVFVVFSIHALLVLSTLLLIVFEKPKERVLPRLLLAFLRRHDERKLY